jgi:hypothetical protein
VSFPFERNPDRCEICGADVGADRLVRVALEHDGTATGRSAIRFTGQIIRVEREIYVCSAHEQRDGGPLVSPRGQQAPGTSRTHPQAEMLF